MAKKQNRPSSKARAKEVDRTIPPEVEIRDGGIYKYLLKEGNEEGEPRLLSDAPIDFAKRLDKELAAWERYARESIAPGARRTNRQALEVLQCLQWMRGEIERGVESRSLYGAFLCGAATEKLYVIPHEDKARKGGRMVRGSQISRQLKAVADSKRREEVRKRCRALLLKNPKITKGKAAISLNSTFTREAGGKRPRGYSESAIRGIIADLF
ncbi:MAG: hypothetical protein K1X71_20925 [Pirellulales bacterium]|nr:hypothetical protein [Pirellulales bacterium]